jgi:hypothetical protein
MPPAPFALDRRAARDLIPYWKIPGADFLAIRGQRCFLKSFRHSSDKIKSACGMQTTIVPIQEIESEADFVLYSSQNGVFSEHCTESEARMAFYKQVILQKLGEHLPIIYERQEPNWVPLK